MKQSALATLLAVAALGAALGTALPTAPDEEPATVLPKDGKEPWRRYSYLRKSCQDAKKSWDGQGIDLFCGTSQYCDLFDSARGSELSTLQESGYTNKKTCLDGHYNEPAMGLFPWVEDRRNTERSVCPRAEKQEVSLEYFDKACGTQHLCKSFYAKFAFMSEQACLDMHEKPRSV